MVLVLVHTESTQGVLRSTQNLHRRFGVHTESTQSDLGSTQSLHRLADSGSTQSNSGPTQGLHRMILCLHRVYTENTDLDRVYTERFGICLKSTESNRDLHRVYTDTRS